MLAQSKRYAKYALIAERNLCLCKDTRFLLKSIII